MNQQMKSITILHLYPKDMNIYGDYGNVLVLKRRVQWHGYQAKVIEYNPGDALPDQIDIIVGGGGQDSGQDIVQSDLFSIAEKLAKLADDGLPMLLICGIYQLFGRSFTAQDGHVIKGIGILDVETVAGPERLAGNTIINSDQFGEIVGYENHSGQTTLGAGTQPLGLVLKGAGNNGQDETEGARFNNIIASYLHGSLLPKNPVIADWLIEQAVTRKYGEFVPTVIDDLFAEEARAVAFKRPR